MGTPMLEVDGLDAWYDRSHVVQGLRFHVDAGEIVTLMGRNGAGKTSTLKAIMGLLAKRGGQVRFDGQEILSQPAHARYHLGLAYVPVAAAAVGTVLGIQIRDKVIDAVVVKTPFYKRKPR